MPERTETAEPFTASRAAFAELLDFAGGQAATALDHARWRTSSPPAVGSCCASSTRTTWTYGRSANAGWRQ